MSSTIWSKLSMALANSRKTGKKASFARREHCVDRKIAACFFSPAGRRNMWQALGPHSNVNVS
ncbi:hypothetical protein [Rhizobium oryzihabitans]|uniref:hypothetical protein n=1 Tax=Rhizobium oryzihabitans TaxID=2267833 RepID=UPI004036EDE3